MNHSCFFTKVCDGEFNNKQLGVTLFLLQLCVREKVLKILCEKTKKLS